MLPPCRNLPSTLFEMASSPPTHSFFIATVGFLSNLISIKSEPHEGGDVALWPLPSPAAYTVFVTD